MRSSGHFFVDEWEGRVANILRATPLDLTSQNKIASCDAFPLGPDLRVALPIRFGIKHRCQSFAFGRGTHAIPQPYACPSEQGKAVAISSRVIASRLVLKAEKNTETRHFVANTMILGRTYL